MYVPEDRSFNGRCEWLAPRNLMSSTSVGRMTRIECIMCVLDQLLLTYLGAGEKKVNKLLLLRWPK
jgi:hypothetical protein